VRFARIYGTWHLVVTDRVAEYTSDPDLWASDAQTACGVVARVWSGVNVWRDTEASVEDAEYMSTHEREDAEAVATRRRMEPPAHEPRCTWPGCGGPP